MPRDTSQSGRTGGASSSGTTWTNGTQVGGGGGGGGSPYMNNGTFTGRYEGNFGPSRQLGLTTGRTIYGNTAFGPSGGRAVGYATKDNYGTMGPGNANYSNFRTRDGRTAFGNVGGMQFNAPNARAAAGYANAMNRAMEAPRPQAVPAGVSAPRPVAGIMGRPAFGPPPALPPQVTGIMGRPAFGPPPAQQWSMLHTPYIGTDEMGRAVGGTAADYRSYSQAWGNDPKMNAYSNTVPFSNSYYNNPTLGTPGMYGGLGNYAPSGGGSNFWNGGLGGNGARPSRSFSGISN